MSFPGVERAVEKRDGVEELHTGPEIRRNGASRLGIRANGAIRTAAFLIASFGDGSRDRVRSFARSACNHS